MKRQSPVRRDLLALDLYERTMQRHKDLLDEAERARMVNQIPVTGKPRRRLVKTLLAAVGGGMVSIGLRLQAAGSQKANREALSFQHFDDL